MLKQVAEKAGPTEFLGHEGRGDTGSGTVRALATGNALVDRAGTGAEVELATDRTPFYGEAGGQVGDVGTARSAGGALLRITDTIKPGGSTIVHRIFHREQPSIHAASSSSGGRERKN